MPDQTNERDLRAKRVEVLAASRPAVAERLSVVRQSREASLVRVRAIGGRLRPSGGLGQELRDRPLRALGLLGILALLLVRWFGSRSGGSASRGGGAGSGRGRLAPPGGLRGGGLAGLRLLGRGLDRQIDRLIAFLKDILGK